MVHIDVISDTVCPWCFIGKRRLEQALSQFPAADQVSVAWRPYQLNPDMPEAGLDRKEYLEAKFGGPEGAEKVYDAIRQAGETVGIAFDFAGIARTPNTVKSHRLVEYAGRQNVQDVVVERLFNAYFLEGKDIGATDVLAAEAAKAAALPEAEVTTFLDSDDGIEKVRHEDSLARQIGIQGVPFFIFNGKYAVSGAQGAEVILEALSRAEADKDVRTVSS